MGRTLSIDTAQQLTESGFAIIPGAFSPHQMVGITAAYDEAMAAAPGDDYKSGSTTDRLFDLVNRGAAFDAVYLHAALLEACAHVIGEPFKLSSLLARTVRPSVPAQPLHRDLPRNSPDAPMVAFILMIDPFRPANGATRFVPQSHTWQTPPDLLCESPGLEVFVCGEVGSFIIFNAAIWHGHAANTTASPRRSIQGYFVRRTVSSGSNFSVRIHAETLARLTPQARELLAIA